ncbi:uncharacterized protein LOC110842374 [Folsomia candida]|uniref:F-box domain-containing protein n=1 Tax=Folsomia candida TaxID=158441 RepID=A0A226EYS9_FOLCA|nr:uncharacterized protein LOC110842374 [Folsomia candida]OXA62689.1 hypothetical protein Fcan01_00298 [Folsomia candida]
MDLDSSHPNKENPHQAVILPQIVANIVTFLPKSDLISCTLINSTWEDEARLPLLFLSQFILDAQNIAHHEEISTVRGNSARNIVVSEFPNLSREGPCGNFFSTHGHKVKRLETRLLQPDVKWSQFFEILSNTFPNLTAVTLFIDHTTPNYTEFPPKIAVFSKVKQLAIYMPSNFMDEDRIRQSVVESFLNFAPTLTSLTLINIPLVGPIRENTVKLTRLEIGHDFIYNLLPPSITAMLKMSSATLVNLRFSRVSNIEPSVVRNYEQLLILFPILPKLRVFELVHNDFSTRLGGTMVTRAINLTFENGSAVTKLPYAEQFPVLETLRVLKGVSSQNDKLTEQQFFEASVSFLYNSFLHPSNTPCLSLRDLAIPDPEGEEIFKFFNVLECVCEKGFYHGECFVLKDPSEVLERAVFPNWTH